MRTDDSQQMTRNVYMDADGTQRLAAAAFVSIRPGRGMTINIDVPMGVTLSDAQLGEVADELAGFLADRIVEAVDARVPVPLMEPCREAE